VQVSSNTGPDANVVSLAVASPPAQPPAGLGSNHNYFLYSNCNPVTNLSVFIDVTWDMVATPGIGFSIQLNAYSAPNHNYSYQQYCITADGARNPPELTCTVCNWPKDTTHFTILQSFDLCPLANDKLPTGYQLQIRLANDSSANINAVTFVVVDNTGTTLASQNVHLLSLKDAKGNAVTSADLAPITAFEVNIVGPYGGESTQFSSGSGTITYISNSSLCPLNQPPTCIESSTPGTAETSNSQYGTLPLVTAISLVQSFLCFTGLPSYCGPA
jgi:hypothetical protein